jgi:hypothetical protein
MLWEMCITHVAFELLSPRSLRTEVVSLPIVTFTPSWVLCGARTVRPRPPNGPDGAPGVPRNGLDDSTDPELKSKLVRKSILPKGVPWIPSTGRPYNGSGSR